MTHSELAVELKEVRETYRRDGRTITVLDGVDLGVARGAPLSRPRVLPLRLRRGLEVDNPPDGAARLPIAVALREA